MHKFVILILLIVFSQHNVSAKQITDTQEWSVDLSQTLEKNTFKPIGNTVFSFLFWDLYKSKLLTTSKQFPLKSEDDKLLYEIEYFKTISAKSLIEKTVEQWQHLGYEASRYESYLNELQRIWPDIKSGDALTLMMDNTSSAFYHNKRLVGVIRDTNFGPLFLDIWLSEKTSEPELRQELLGIK